MRRLWRTALQVSMNVPPVRQQVRRWTGDGRVPKKLWNRLPIVEEMFAVELPGGQRFFYRSAAGDAIGQAFYWRGLDGWESATIHTFLALAERARHFLDIGANTGAYSLLACAVNPTLQATAYEPVPRVYERLSANLQANQFGARCRAKAVAVADTVGNTRFHVPHSAMPSSASMAPDGFRALPGQLIEVPMTTADADTDTASGAPPVDLVKIDVEGFEHLVLAGMTRLLREDRPVIVCECNPDGPIAAIEQPLRAADYLFFHVRSPHPERMSSIRPDPTERYRNFVCVPSEDRDTAAIIGALRL